MIRQKLGPISVRFLQTGMWWQRHDPLRHDALRGTILGRITSFSVGYTEPCFYNKKHNFMEVFRQIGHWWIINDV